MKNKKINTKPLSIFFIAAEVAPFATVGGLSQVLYFLPKALKRLGHEVTIFMPKYGTIDEKKYRIKPFLTNLKVPTGETSSKRELICNVKVRLGNTSEPTVYFLENMEYYEKRANVYNYSDDSTRFALLSRGAIEFLRLGKVKPDVVHANDWHTGYLINYLRTEYKDDPALKAIATLFTIHNLALQGVYDFNYSSPSEMDDGRGVLVSFFSERFKRQNALKRGILYADIVNTVSERYAREIMTPAYGHGLDPLLKELRAKIYGVLNGLDYEDFDPATDTLIRKNFTVKTLRDRVQNKIDLQKEFNLPIDSSVPILAMVGRLSEQKGIELVMKVIPYILKEQEIQFIVLGEGENKYREFFGNLEKENPRQVATHLLANWQLPRKIFAGVDMLLMPSKFEPGGIVVIEAMRYGAVPIVRATGGLADTVSDFNIGTNTGTGFAFREYSELSLFGVLTRALEIYQATPLWQGIVKRALKADFSWNASAIKYLDLYKRAIDYRREALSENPAYAFRQI